VDSSLGAYGFMEPRLHVVYCFCITIELALQWSSSACVFQHMFFSYVYYHANKITDASRQVTVLSRNLIISISFCGRACGGSERICSFRVQ
jgi:hypothetical protein